MVTIQGSGLGDTSTTVVIGSDVCLVLNATADEIVCRVSRNKTVIPSIAQVVKIDVAGKGFAVQDDVLNALPVVNHGFAVSHLSYYEGSYYGGNQITIFGFGFLDHNIAKYAVELVTENVVLTPYQQILEALGSSSAPKLSVGCDIIAVSSTSIDCVISPGKADTIMGNSTKHLVTVILNGVSSTCQFQSGNSSACTYSQTSAMTPIVEEAKLLRTFPDGSVLVNITGTKFDPSSSGGPLSVWIGEYPCVVQSHSNTNALVRSLPLPFGLWNVSLLIPGVGFAKSLVNISTAATIFNVGFSVVSGSIAGGTKMVISGFGFAPFNNVTGGCGNNVGAIALQSEALNFSVPLAFTSCNTTNLGAILPSILGETFVSSVKATSITLQSSQSKNLTWNDLSFSYTLSSTPIATTTILSGSSSTLLKYSMAASHVVSQIIIGGAVCSQLASSLNGETRTWSCLAPPLPSGTYPVLLSTELGYAVTSSHQFPTFTSVFRVNRPMHNVVNSSTLGKLSVTVTGQGLSANCQVSVCGQPCPESSATYDSIACSLPSVFTKKAVGEIQTHNISLDMIARITEGITIASNPNATLMDFVSDLDYLTFYQHFKPNCFVGLQMPPGRAVLPHRVRFYPRMQYSNLVKNVVFEGSNDGKSYITLGTGVGAHEGWNYITANGPNARNWYSYLRFRPKDGATFCQLAEVDFWGVAASSSPYCPINVTDPATGVSLIGGEVAYRGLDLTPVVRQVSPNNGTALGGTTVVISGFNFSPLGSAPSPAIVVEFSGMPCHVIESLSTVITCISSPRPPSAVETMSIKVWVAGRGLALVDDRAEFLYIDKWSALTSWKNQELPLDGDLVWIPDGQVILLDVFSPVLSVVLIEGALYFDPTKSVSLDASYIFVNGGLLQVGTAEEPYEQNATITLHGDRYKTVEIPIIGAKVLAVSSYGLPMSGQDTGVHMPSRTMGQLEIHGKKRLRTWTKINQTVFAGSDHFFTSERVDFAPGETLVVPGTEVPRGSPDVPSFDYEVVVVQENIDGHKIVVTEPFQFTHRSEIIFMHDRYIDLRCEVGLLSRNVILQGDPSNSMGQLFGMHTVAMGSGIYRVENAEVRNCGQGERNISFKDSIHFSPTPY